MNRRHLCASSALTILLALGASQAFAAPAAKTGPTDVSEVVVTGSMIGGTPKDAALPVDVVTQQMLTRRGAPTIIELIKQLPESSGVIGESNQFVAGGRGQGLYGASTVNLRGLGPERTLTLFNGHRLPLAFAIAPDPNVLPLAAVSRVEVLKDGAAATYGSDAIAGVVNFITLRSYDGLEVNADYRWVDGSDGNDWQANFKWGKVGSNWDVLVTGGYQHRSQLPVLGKDWAHKIYDQNPEGGWTGGGNPEAFIPTTAGGLPFLGVGAGRIDLGCTALGGQLTTAKPANAAPLLPWTSCRGQYSIWDNLEEEENRYQAFAQLNWKFAEHHELHLDAAYGYTDLPFFKSSPSYVTTRPVPGAVLPTGFPLLTVAGPPASSLFYFVPATNPGFAAYQAANPGQFPPGTGGAVMTIGTFRPYLTGGNPLYNYQHGVGGPYWHDQILLDAGLKGDVATDVQYDVNLSYGRYKSYGEGRDSLTDRLQLALRGLGGPGCDYKTGTPGVGGCQWLNPFSNAIPGAPNRGLTNPGFVPALANTAQLADWIMPTQSATTNFQEYEFDGVLSGKLPWTLSGGAVKWAAGVQWRHNSYVTDYSQFGNEVISPCSNSVPPVGLNDCIYPSNPNPAVTTGTGPNVFGPVSVPVDISQDIYAAFGELNLPITDTINLELAARFEDYGSNGGDTFNPQARLRWQANDWLAFRGSVGTTFRAPPQGSLIPNPTTNLQQVLGTFIPVSTIGNPELEPETALVYSVGAIVQNGGFRATMDYWNYDFQKVLTSEPLTPVVNAVFPNGASGANNCGDASLAGFISAHFVFNGPCGPGVVAVNLQAINGPTVKTDGVDFDISYTWPEEVFGGQLIASALFTHVNNYTVGALQIGTVTIPSYEAAGFFNSGQIAYPIPQWKGTFSLNYEHGPFNLHYQFRYIDQYIDQRSSLFTFNPIYVTPTNPSGIVTAGQKIKAQMMSDVTLLWHAPYDTQVTLAMSNIFDENPSFARTDINYDALTGDPLGRTFKLGLTKKF